MDDMYKYAAKNGLRFPSARGLLTVEQLFDLDLKSRTGFDLDTTARSINNALKQLGEESFVDDRPNPAKQPLEVAFEIVKDVIKTKQAENAAQLAKAQKVIDRKKILDAMSAKKDAALTTASMEELEKQLAALDD